MKRMRDGSYTIKPTYKVGEHDIVPDMLAKRALLHPDQVAVEQRSSVGSTRSLTTSELQRQVEYTACGLIGLGVQAGDAVAILAPTSYEWLLLDLALLSIGAITVPIYESDSAAQIEHILTDAHVTPRLHGHHPAGRACPLGGPPNTPCRSIPSTAAPSA